MLTLSQQIFELIKKSSHILITFGGETKQQREDNLSSALSLFLFLKKIGQNSEVVTQVNQTPFYGSFLPYAQEIKSEIDPTKKFIINLDISKTQVEEVSYEIKNHLLQFYIKPQNGTFKNKDISTFEGNLKYDLIFVLGTTDLEQLGELYEKEPEFFYNTPLINIDHSPANENFGQINLVKLTATSVAEIIFHLISDFDSQILDEDLATCLLTGLIIKTKNFKTITITPQALNMAGQLLSWNARREEILSNLYPPKTTKVLKLWGRILIKINLEADFPLARVALNKEDFLKTETSPLELEDILEELGTYLFQEAKIILFVYQDLDDRIYGLIKSENYDVLELTRDLNGQGNRALARLTLPQSEIEPALNQVVKTIKEKFDIMK